MNHVRQQMILVIDDTPANLSLLNQLLRPHYHVRLASSGARGLELAAMQPPDLVLLDIMMPGEDGLSLTRHLRDKGDMPIILLTARGEETDRIVGIEMGADDYLVKPFNPRELLARIKTILRRTRALPPNLRPETARYLNFAGWCLDTAARLLTAPDGVATPLSGGEYRLLRILLDHPNRVLNRDQLTEMIHGREADAFDRAIDVQVSRLRQRLRDDSREPTLIKTVRGEGYVLAASVEGHSECA